MKGLKRSNGAILYAIGLKRLPIAEVCTRGKGCILESARRARRFRMEDRRALKLCNVSNTLFAKPLGNPVQKKPCGHSRLVATDSDSKVVIHRR